MKKSISLLSFTLFLFAFTHDAYSQTFRVKGGLNLSNLSIKYIDPDDEPDEPIKYKMNPGFHLGVTAEIPVTEIISFESGLLLSTKGAKVSLFDDDELIEAKISPLYLDIPLMARTAYAINDTKIYGIFGPYLGIGLGGKMKQSITGTGPTETGKKDISWGAGGNNDFKRLDFGLTIGAGLEIKTLEFGLSYSLGLANISANTDYNKTRNRVLALTVAYKFMKK